MQIFNVFQLKLSFVFYVRMLLFFNNVVIIYLYLLTIKIVWVIILNFKILIKILKIL